LQAIVRAERQWTAQRFEANEREFENLGVVSRTDRPICGGRANRQDAWR
jgi:hypothetical protein